MLLPGPVPWSSVHLPSIPPLNSSCGRQLNYLSKKESLIQNSPETLPIFAMLCDNPTAMPYTPNPLVAIQQLLIISKKKRKLTRLD